MEPDSQPANSTAGTQLQPVHSVVEQLEKILSSPSFANSARLSRFLRYIVEQAMNGRSHQLKEYMLGLDVFDRPESFDPRTDAVVRVEAGRLRSKLRGYYNSEGQEDPLVIELPKGSYAPTFTIRSSGALQGNPGRKRPLKLYLCVSVPVVLLLALFGIQASNPPEPLPLSDVGVLPFEDLSANQLNQSFVDGFVEELTHSLADVRGFNVAARPSAFELKGKTKNLTELGHMLKVGSVLEGRIRNTGSRIRLTVELIGVSDGYHLWSEVYERDLEDRTRLFEIQDEIALAVTRALAPRLLSGWQERSLLATPGGSRSSCLD